MSQGIIDIPNVRTAITVKEDFSAKQRNYRGIMSSMLVQAILADAIGGMAICSKCVPTELNNMITDKVGIQAAKRSI